AAVVIVMNGILVYLQVGEWAAALEASGRSPWWVYGTLLPLAGLLAAFLGWVMVYPLWSRREAVRAVPALPALAAVHYRRIGVAVELEGADAAVLTQAAALARQHQARLVAVHVVEGTAAALLGPEADDQESRSDRQRIADLV